MFDSGARQSGACVGVVVTVVVLSSLALAGGYGAVSPVGSAAAATDTDVYLSPGDAVVGVDGTVTYDVVVGTVRGGVGSYDLTVLSTSPSVAKITDVSAAAGGSVDTNVDSDGSQARIGAFAADTVDTGTNVTVARVTVAGNGQVGRSTLLLDVRSIGDEDGDQYGIDETPAGRVRVRTAGFRLQSLVARPSLVTLGESVEFTARIENTGPVAGETTVVGIFDGSTVGERTVNVSAGGIAEATFRTTPPSPGTYDLRVNGRDITSSSTSITVREVPDVTGSGGPATDPDDDGLYEDVNGDGDVTPGDATVLFDAVFDRAPVVLDNPDLFDFNRDGIVTPGDATVLFNEAF